MLNSAGLSGASTDASRPGVSVCIIAWNDGPNVARCLTALPAAGDGLDLQVIIVDNGSTDDTAQVLAQHPSVQVIRNRENRGITRARNQALALVRRDIVLMLDADTVPAAGCIRVLHDYLKQNPQVGLVGPKMVNPDGTLQLSCRTVSSPLLPFLRRPPLAAWGEHSELVSRHLMRDFAHDHTRPVDWVIGAAQCYRADVLPLVGAYDEQIFSHGGEDSDWCLRVWKAGFEVHYLPYAVVMHDYGHFTRKHPFSRQARRGLLDYYYMVWKHRDVRRGVTAS